MSVGFPPTPVYPTGIDSNFTLYLVYNTTEAVVTANNAAWSEEIPIRPQPAVGAEIWADNGFATIEGELLYYDAVEKDLNGKVSKLKRCLRNLGGRHTQFNACGTWVRGFVVAEHHTQLVGAALKVEDFVGENFTLSEETLDWRIRNLRGQPIVFDDFSCPDVEFDFNILSSDVNTGTVAQFFVRVQGSFGFVEVQFGDGTSTTATAGTHSYAPNGNIDPVVIVSNENCQIVQTPIEREETEEPSVRAPTPPFSVPVPVSPDIPPFNFPNPSIPSVDINIPPIVFPCIDLNPILGGISALISVIEPVIQIPSIISFVPPLDIPSIITFTPILNIPTTITFTNVPSFGPIGFGPVPSFGPIGFGPAPSFIIATFGPAPSFGPIGFGPAPTFGPIGFGPAPTFGPIGFGPAPTFGPIGFGPAPLFGPIGFGPPPVFAPIGFDPPPVFAPIGFGPTPSFQHVDFGPAPAVSVFWGTPPSLNCSCIVTCPSATPFAEQAPFGMGGQDGSFDNVEVQYDMVGFPSEIKIVPPHIPPVQVSHNIPDVIKLLVPDNIRIIAPEVPIPSEIRIVPPDLDTVLTLEVPEFIKLNLDTSAMPTAISVVFPENLPEIKIDASGIPETIKVIGIPDIIRVEHNVPSVITIDVPSDLKIPLVFEGPPISAEIKVNWGFDKTLEGIESPTCFTILPCPKK